MNTDAVIFDKDGTLLDFDKFWVTVSVNALKEILAEFKMQKIPVDEILTSLGVHNGVTDIDGILCKGTYKQMGKAIYDVLCRYGCEASCDDVTSVVLDAFNNNSDKGEVKATTENLREVLVELKNRNKKLAVVTTDNKEITHRCLKTLGVDDLFDKIYTDDGSTPTKPNPFCAIDFCKSYGINPKHTVMVGDTMTDMNFAKNAGIGVIGIAKNDSNREKLLPYADFVVDDLANILDILK